jgi:hypothetical protein
MFIPSKWLLLLALGVLGACKETKTPEPNPPFTTGWRTFSIPEGSNQSLDAAYSPLKSNLVQFQLTFDSSAVYRSVHNQNQGSWNTVVGFSDCGETDSVHSLRLLWRYTPGTGIELGSGKNRFAQFAAQVVDTVQVGDTNHITLAKVLTEYQLTVNERRVKHPRPCEDVPRAYWLYPDFGGPEVAPHPIAIHLRFIHPEGPQ